MDYIEIEKALRASIINPKLDVIAIYFSSNQILENFIGEVDDLTRTGEGSAIEGVLGCTFPRQLDEYEVVHHGFNGVNFSLFEKEITIDIYTFRKYLRMACEAYWQIYPDSRKQLEEYLARPQPPLEEGALPEWKRRRDAGQYAKPISEAEQ